MDVYLESAGAGVGKAEEVVKARLGRRGSRRSSRGAASTTHDAAGRRSHAAGRMLAAGGGRARLDRVGRSATGRTDHKIQRRPRPLSLYIHIHTRARVIDIWNSLPSNAVDFTSLACLKRSISSNVFPQYLAGL